MFGKSPLRTQENVQKIADLIRDIHERNHLIHHRFHLRLEIDNIGAYGIAKEMIEKKMIDEISFMDHSPGQGQYRNLDLYYKVLEKYQNREIKEEEFAELLEKQNHKDVLSFGQMKELCELAHANGIAVASHDDDTKEKLRINEKIGVDISEFPINIETAKEARQLGFYTVVGAPFFLLVCSLFFFLSANINYFQLVIPYESVLP